MNLQSAEVSHTFSLSIDTSQETLTVLVQRGEAHTDIPQYEDNKGFAEDLSEGKFSFPVVHGIRADGTNRQILSELSQMGLSQNCGDLVEGEDGVTVTVTSACFNNKDS